MKIIKYQLATEINHGTPRGAGHRDGALRC